MQAMFDLSAPEKEYLANAISTEKNRDFHLGTRISLGHCQVPLIIKEVAYHVTFGIYPGFNLIFERLSHEVSALEAE